MTPAIEMTDLKKPANMHQNKCQCHFGERPQFHQDIRGQQYRQIEQMSEGWTNQQTGHQVTGHSRNMTN